MGPVFQNRALPAPGEGVLDEAAAHLWLASFDLDRDATDADRETLTPDESARATDMAAIPGRRFIASRATLRRLLATYLGGEPQTFTLSYESRGKPALAGVHARSGLHFNLSHSADHVLVAIGVSPLGVDLEARRQMKDLDALAKRFFSPGEALALREVDRSERHDAFLAQWTCKEAYLKARGTGVSMPLSSIEIVSTDPEGRGEALVDGQRDARYALHRLKPGPGLFGALACRVDYAPPQCWSVDPEPASARHRPPARSAASAP